MKPLLSAGRRPEPPLQAGDETQPRSGGESPLGSRYSLIESLHPPGESRGALLSSPSRASPGDESLPARWGMPPRYFDEEAYTLNHKPHTLHQTPCALYPAP